MFDYFTNIPNSLEAFKEGFDQKLGEALASWSLKKLKNIANKEPNDIEEEKLIINKLNEFLYRQYKKNYYLPTIVLDNICPLYKLYIPLTIKINDTNESYKVDGENFNFIEKYKKILITDTAGMGKSTLSRYIILKEYEKNENIPVFVELRQISEKTSLLTHITNILQPTAEDEKINDEKILKSIKKGGYIFVLDGYDEINLAIKEKLTNEIREFVAKYGANYFLITSRPEISISSFPEFQNFKINPLEAEEAYLLIKKYDSDGERSFRLISKLQDQDLKGIEEFLKSPLLVTLLYRSYEYKQQIPLKKSIFYRQVYDALYSWHDLSKEGYSTRVKLSGLDPEEFHKVLRVVGYLCIKTQKNQFTVDEIINFIEKSKKKIIDAKFISSNFLDDSLKAVPLLKKEGDYIYWAHKSLSEYFCAMYLAIDAKSNQKEIFSKLITSDNFASYANMLDIFFDIDNESFHRHFTKVVIDDYKKHFSELKSFYPSLPNESIAYRASTTLYKDFNLIKNIEDYKYNQKNIAQIFMDFSKKNSPPMPIIYNYQFKDIFNGKLCLILSNQKNIILDILNNKKHYMIKQRSLYPEIIKKLKIPIGGKKNNKIDDSPENSWNSEKNFQNTTRALMQSLSYIIDYTRINEIERAISLAASNDDDEF